MLSPAMTLVDSMARDVNAAVKREDAAERIAERPGVPA
jgi:hypothetical protein